MEDASSFGVCERKPCLAVRAERYIPEVAVVERDQPSATKVSIEAHHFVWICICQTIGGGSYQLDDGIASSATKLQLFRKTVLWYIATLAVDELTHRERETTTKPVHAGIAGEGYIQRNQGGYYWLQRAE